VTPRHEERAGEEEAEQRELITGVHCAENEGR
jgi:hypothetical protein